MGAQLWLVMAHRVFLPDFAAPFFPEAYGWRWEGGGSGPPGEADTAGAELRTGFYSAGWFHSEPFFLVHLILLVTRTEPTMGVCVHETDVFYRRRKLVHGQLCPDSYSVSWGSCSSVRIDHGCGVLGWHVCIQALAPSLITLITGNTACPLADLSPSCPNPTSFPGPCVLILNIISDARTHTVTFKVKLDV